ncbi:MAG: hypothetical protein Q4615_04210 [Paracoccus aminovorans]|nr:hypothetical protein [Paracoccus aminovorans]
MVDEATVPRFDESADEYPATVPMLQNGMRPTGGPVNPVADEGLLNWPLREIVKRLGWLKRRYDAMAAKADSVVTVGPGGQYANLNAALAALSEKRPVYKTGGISTRVQLLTGYVMAEQVLLIGVNLGWVEIVSVDAEVLIDRTALVTNFGGTYPAFGVGAGGVLPRIAVLFTMNGTGDGASRCGLHAAATGSATIAAGGGFKSCAADALRADTASQVSADSTVLTGAGSCGVRLVGGARVSVQNANISNAGDTGIDAGNGGTVNAQGANCAGANVRGMRATRGASINAAGATARRNGAAGADTTTDLVVEQGGIIVASAALGGTSVTANQVAAAGIIFK